MNNQTQSSNIIFGPVPSRRFGISLGIDLSPDTKQCNFDCLYCELKAAKTVDSMSHYPSVEEILNAVKNKLQSSTSKIEVLTLTANGEPTLYPYLKELVTSLKTLNKEIKLLILSNGSTIYKRKVQEALLDIDIVKLSLDCVSKECFNKLDRPHKSVEVDKIVTGMVEFQKIFKNELVLEILFVKSLNNKNKEIELLKNAIKEIKPSRVDLSTIDRPPAYKVEAISFEELEEIASKLDYPYINIAHKHRPIFEATYSKDEILALLQRRPLSKFDIEHTFSNSSRSFLNELIDDKKVEIIDSSGVEFYKIP
ncbi:MAG: radical SAM protein [Arcobacteraceae bacterium]|nr:radical SAM protein [Arcobacteraceae bacterium]MDY0365799.1 radical SAM protein [Arcobacteraceae bacterium]